MPVGLEDDGGAALLGSEAGLSAATGTATTSTTGSTTATVTATACKRVEGTVNRVSLVSGAARLVGRRADGVEICRLAATTFAVDSEARSS